MRINTNIAAMDAQRNLALSGLSMQKSIERLSSGLRINRAADDAAGLSISEKMRAEIRGLSQAVRNAQDGISLVQTAEGALNEVHDILQRMNELALQGASGTLSTDDQQAVYAELEQIQSEINRIANVTNFNGIKLFNGPAPAAGTPGDVVNVSSPGGGADTLSAGVGNAGNLADGSYKVVVTAVNAGAIEEVELFDANDVSLGTATVDNTGATGVAQFANGVTLNFSKGGTNAVDDEHTFDVTNAVPADPGGVNVELHIGAGTSSDEHLTLNIQSVATNLLGNVNGNSLDDAMAALKAAIDSGTDVQQAFRDLADSVVQGVKDVSEIRSGLGAYQNRLEHTINNLNVAIENLSASESRIRDADMSAEVVNMTRAQILQQAGTAVLAQANQMPQMVLSLLR